MTPDQPRLTIDEAVRFMRERPEYADVVRDAYLGRDVEDSYRRFANSAEFDELRTLLAEAIPDGVVVDLGAGTGIASRAFLDVGARHVYALEPDPSDEVGQGAIRRLAGSRRVEIVSSYAERIPLASGSVDIVYARQVLHHTRDLDAAVAECARVLRPGGYFVACREHVVADDAELAEFLARHPVHQLAGGEHAYTLEQYTTAIERAGLRLVDTLAPWDSVINAFPMARSAQELRNLPRRYLTSRFGPLGGWAARIPFVADRFWTRIRRASPGQMYSFITRRADGRTT
ncbi:MAG: class I SAM-dependent methyltransferase [Gemmatimonadaceae bacterium]